VRFIETRIPGAWRIELERRQDDRGFFARSFCEREFADRGLAIRYPQCNISYNKARGTLRGMHFQRPPEPEIKVVRCLRGSVYDVILDLRPDSSSYLRWEAFELTEDNRNALYIPEGCAHGFQTLTDDAELFYQMGAFYAPDCNDGVRWDDPAFGIAWPLADPILSDKDRSYPDFQVSPWAPAERQK
jgi:dTDP-4-dehydrorhamnose 3,5-epimerase